MTAQPEGEALPGSGGEGVFYCPVLMFSPRRVPLRALPSSRCTRCCCIHGSGTAEAPTEGPTAAQLGCGRGCPDVGSRTSPERPAVTLRVTTNHFSDVLHHTSAHISMNIKLHLDEELLS